jgi:hypothetical protein
MSTWHAINIIVSAIFALAWLVWAFRNRDIWRYSIAPLSYLAHVIMFYIFAALHVLCPEDLNAWSNAIRLHGLILIGSIAIALVCAERCILWKRPKS